MMLFQICQEGKFQKPTGMSWNSIQVTGISFSKQEKIKTEN